MLTEARKWEQASKASDQQICERVAPGGLYSVARRGQTIQVRRGRAWITFEGMDHILEPGDMLRLFQGEDPALVSALGAGHLELTVRQG